MIHTLDGVHEVAGTGTIFWDEEAGGPAVHLHMACGRGDGTATGCVRQGVRVWQTMEVVLFELIDSTAARVFEPALGFKLLEP
jgi:predicted DNA-binding protein with PD1-like motif